MKKIVGSLLLILAAFACNSKTRVPDGIIPMPRMQAILWDLFRADGLTQAKMLKKENVQPDKENVVLFQQILSYHKQTRETFFKSYEYYLAHPDKFKILLDSLTAMSLRYTEEINNNHQNTKEQANGSHSTHASN